MRKVKTNRFTPFILAVLLLFTGCHASSNMGGGSNNGAIKGAEDLMRQVKETTWPSAADSIDSRFQKALYDFSWKLFKESSKNKNNILISPASVYLALGMTYNGANTETLEAMAQTLQAVGLSEEEFNRACRDYISILRTAGDKTELSIANSIWYRQGYNPSVNFLQKNADYFAAAVKALDFDSPDAVQTINGWVKEETKDTIDKIIDEIQTDVIMYLINAVYFKSDWQEAFNAADTQKAQFQAASGPIEAEFMNRTGNMDYIDRDGIKGIILPYDDNRFNFFALLPEDGTDVRSFIQRLDGETISNYLKDIKNDFIALSLPKFETRYEDSLKDELTNLGMGIAFDANNADFSRMNDKGLRDLYISEVRHKTFCRVDEKGTEASAVTSVEIRLTALPLEPDIRISFDRPFVYGIVDTVTGAPLFLGLMENPTN